MPIDVYRHGDLDGASRIDGSMDKELLKPF